MKTSKTAKDFIYGHSGLGQSEMRSIQADFC
jgi:hypothetical protein